MEEYAIYKGDTYLFSGTAEECANYRGVKVETIKYWTTPTYEKRLAKRKRSKNPLIVIKLD